MATRFWTGEVSNDTTDDRNWSDRPKSPLPTVAIATFTVPRVQSQLTLGPDFYFRTNAPAPNAWVRFWLWFLLGWKWEKID